MLIKAGVDISRLNPGIRKKLTIIDGVVRFLEGEELVVTSTYEGNHLPSSLHYCDDAIDLRIFKKPKEVERELINKLGKDYYIYLARTHIHIGYNPK